MSGNDKTAFPTSSRRQSASEILEAGDISKNLASNEVRTIDDANFRVRIPNPESADRAKRLREAVQRAGGNKAVAAKSHVPISTLNLHISGGEMKLGTAVALAEACDISLEWLATGRSEIAVSSSTAPKVKFHQPHLKNFAMIPRYDVKAAAGAGSEVEAENLLGYLALDEAFLRTHIGRPFDNLVTIEATGDSMIPTILDGALLVVDTSVHDIDDGRIYVLDVDGRLLVKRLHIRSNGSIVIRSDNAAYEPEIVVPSEADPLRIVGQVVYQAGPVRP